MYSMCIIIHLRAPLHRDPHRPAHRQQRPRERKLEPPHRLRVCVCVCE